MKSKWAFPIYWYNFVARAIFRAYFPLHWIPCYCKWIYSSVSAMAKHSCKCFMLHLDKEFRILSNIKGSQGPYFIRKLSPLLIKPDVGGRCVKNQSKGLWLWLAFNKAAQWFQTPPEEYTTSPVKPISTHQPREQEETDCGMWAGCFIENWKSYPQAKVIFFFRCCLCYH